MKSLAFLRVFLSLSLILVYLFGGVLARATAAPQHASSHQAENDINLADAVLGPKFIFDAVQLPVPGSPISYTNSSKSSNTTVLFLSAPTDFHGTLNIGNATNSNFSSENGKAQIVLSVSDFLPGSNNTLPNFIRIQTNTSVTIQHPIVNNNGTAHTNANTSINAFNSSTNATYHLNSNGILYLQTDRLNSAIIGGINNNRSTNDLTCLTSGNLSNGGGNGSAICDYMLETLLPINIHGTEFLLTPRDLTFTVHTNKYRPLNLVIVTHFPHTRVTINSEKYWLNEVGSHKFKLHGPTLIIKANKRISIFVSI
jgi:hypothetical protein